MNLQDIIMQKLPQSNGVLMIDKGLQIEEVRLLSSQQMKIVLHKVLYKIGFGNTMVIYHSAEVCANKLHTISGLAAGSVHLV